MSDARTKETQMDAELRPDAPLGDGIEIRRSVATSPSVDAPPTGDPVVRARD